MKTLLQMLGRSRVLRVSVLCLPVALVSIAIILWLNSKVSVDELSVIVAIPVMISYLMVRGIDRLFSDVPEMTLEQQERVRRMEQDGSVIAVPPVIGIIFIAGAWVCVATGLSIGFYKLLGLSWGFSAALSVLKFALLLIAGISVTVCLKCLLRSWLVKTAQFLRSLSRFPTFSHHSWHC
jgi:hypothetical protein